MARMVWHDRPEVHGAGWRGLPATLVSQLVPRRGVHRAPDGGQWSFANRIRGHQVSLIAVALIHGTINALLWED